jgi:hypothetical protein
MIEEIFTGIMPMAIGGPEEPTCVCGCLCTTTDPTEDDYNDDHDNEP